MSPASTEALAERERNRLLRRADWRYLLPDPSPRRALCLAGASLREVCGVVAGSVDDAPQSGARYDLVVAEDPDDATLLTATNALSANGACYTEWSARLPGAAARARGAVEAAGLRDARSYRPWPTVDQCRGWIPTEGDAASWWWKTAAQSTDVRRQQFRAAVGALQSRLGAHGRLSVVARAADASAEPRLLALALEHRALGSANESKGVLLLTPGERAVGKVILFPFTGDEAPAVAIKTARIADAARGLEREADLLDVVHAQHGGALAGAPRVLFRDRVLDTIVVGESALTGVPLLARIHARSYASIAERVSDWLVQLATPGLAATRRSAWEHVGRQAFDRFASEFGALVDGDQLARTRDILATLGALPVGAEQRDCSPWNVFESGQNVYLLDWESGVAEGVPALDLIYFITHAAFYLEGAWVSGRYEEAYRSAWTQSDLGRINHACVARHLERVQVPAELLPALRLLAWVIHAHSDWVHCRDDAGAEPSVEALRDSRFLRLYRAELESL